MSLGQKYMERVASLGCCVCRRIYGNYVPASVHHVAEGSGVRSDFSVAALCPEHHTGPAGFHVLGTKRFCSLYRVPGETEYGLLVWTNEDMAKFGHIQHEGELAAREAIVSGLILGAIAKAQQDE